MISQRYIEQVVQLFELSDKQKGDLLKQSAYIDETFAEYSWEDVSSAISAFYTKKYDGKTPPKPMQIKALLDNNSKVKKSIKQDFEDIVKPYTNIKMIQDCYYDVCRLKYLYGLAYSDYFDKIEHLRFGNKMRIVVKTAPTGEKDYRLVNLSWLWEDALLEAKKRFPDVFEKFKYANENELYAIAYKMGVLKLDLNRGKS